MTALQPAPPANAANPGADQIARFLAQISPLLPDIAARTEEADRLRDTPVPTISALARSGLLRMFQPARWGGHEADPRTFYAVQNRIAEVCPSTAWVYGVLNVQSLVVALFSDRAQADVWGEDATALVCSSFAPTGVAVREGDQFKLSGRWTFASGCSHARWALLGARVDGPDGSAAGLNLFLVPRDEYSIVDVWNTFGMRGTGSNDILVEGVPIPTHRRLILDPGIQTIASAQRPGPALYRLPWLYIFASSISNLAIGSARGALRAFLDITRDRISPLTGKVAREDPAVLRAAAQLDARINAMEAMYDRHITQLLLHADSDEPIDLEEAWLLRMQLTSALRELTQCLDDLMLLQGARAIALSSPVARAWLDLSAARAHIGNDPTTAASMLGGMLMNPP